MQMQLLLLLLLSKFWLVKSALLEHHFGVDVIFDRNWKVLASDVYLSKRIYFIVVWENSKSMMKTVNFTAGRKGEVTDTLEYPVQSAVAVAVDWVNGNLYWADKINRFIEVVDLNQGLGAPIPRERRRMLFSRGMADIYSLVADPLEQYLFWLQIGADMVLERARLDGSDRTVIHRAIQYKSSRLAIDRHRKMLFWWGMAGTLHRVDYQGQTGCVMQLEGEWKEWSPSSLLFADSKLVFFNEGLLWETSFVCGRGSAVVLNFRHPHRLSAIIASKHQLAAPSEKLLPSMCLRKLCPSICLPVSDGQYRCACMTGVDPEPNQSACPAGPVRSLIVASPPHIYRVSLDGGAHTHLEPLYEDAGIPFRLAHDAGSASLLYVDYNSSSVYSLSLDHHHHHGSPRKLVIDYPLFSQIPASLAVDSPSRTVYWMNHRSSEVWVARLSTDSRLRYAAMLLSWPSPSSLREGVSGGGRGTLSSPPGELAVDSINRYLFVTINGDGVHSVERYWLDGSHKYVVISSPNIVMPRGLALDEKGQRLFLVDAARDEMICVDYHGNNVRIVARKFADMFGLTYIDDWIYWTDIETLSVHMIASNGSGRGMVATTHDMRAPTMPIIAVSQNPPLVKGGPCQDSVHRCDQLCFPSRISDQSYSCGCSNPAHVLLNLTRCSHSATMIVYYNHSAMITQQLAGAHPDAPPFKSTFSFDSKPNRARHARSMHLDHFRNHIYWINEPTNCVMKTSAGSPGTRNEWRILCLSADRISSIALDIARNNLYVTITSPIWSRIKLIRLPFPNSEISWRKLVVSSQKQNKVMGAIAVHSLLKFMFWFEVEFEDRFRLIKLQQAFLDGSSPELVWRGTADSDELVVDEHSNYICWKNTEAGKIYRYDIINKTMVVFQLSRDIMNKADTRSADWLHVFPVIQSLYLFLHDSIYHLESADTSLYISYNRLKLVIHIGSPLIVKGFSFVSRTTSTSKKKVAMAKGDVNGGSIIMCPGSRSKAFVQCSQFCLPTPQKQCDCASKYSLSLDGFNCTDSNDYLMIMTDRGEIIGIRVNGGTEKHEDLQLVEWIDVPEQNVVSGRKFIDAVYWLSRDVVLKLDNHGYLSATDHTRSFFKTKVYKQLSVHDGGNSTIYSSAYDKIYRHFHEKESRSRDQYEFARFSLAVDPVSNLLLWSDWVSGIIAAEQLNSDRNRIDLLGIILDFRHSSRRPLQIAIAPISSSLIWVSADFAISASNDTSIWRQFWIEMSDLDGSRRSVLLSDPGVPSCLTVDVHSGRIYWIDLQTSKLMYLHVYWDKYQLRVVHVFGQNMKVTVSSLLPTRMGSATSAMVVLKKHLFWTDWFQQVVASYNLDSVASVKPMPDNGSPEKTRTYNLRYLKHKLKDVVRIMARLAREDFKVSSLGTLLQNHPCSHVTHAPQDKPCSHLCLSTLPISLAEEYSFLMTAQQLAGKFRCSCPLSMAIMPTYKVGVCIKSQYVRCDKHQILCRAGQVFTKREGLSATNCLTLRQQCDLVEDCLDGSDESGCNHCQNNHSYSCSGSGLCLPLNKRCNGVSDCESDEQCCSSQKFECLSGKDTNRCLNLVDRCNGVKDCSDGSDEYNCHGGGSGGKIDRISNGDEGGGLSQFSHNHTVAIITGTVALSACSIAVIYICLSRHNRHKTVHESCLFRANNVNIMFMSPSQRTSRRTRYQPPPDRSSSNYNLYHAKSCDLTEQSKPYEDGTDPASQSLTSLSDCYRRIKNPQPPYLHSVVGRPLFSVNDDIMFQLSRIRSRPNRCLSDESLQKPKKPPPSVVTVDSEEAADKANQDNIVESSGLKCFLKRFGHCYLSSYQGEILINAQIFQLTYFANALRLNGSRRSWFSTTTKRYQPQMISRNSLVSSMCESELEEIYVHRYQLMRRPSVLENYPSCLLQNLLSACNQNSQAPNNSPIMSSRDLIVENIYCRRRKKQFKRRNHRKSSKQNLSLSISRRAKLNLSREHDELYVDSSSNLQISPPPPSPITVASL